MPSARSDEPSTGKKHFEDKEKETIFEEKRKRKGKRMESKGIQWNSMKMIDVLMIFKGKTMDVNGIQDAISSCFTMVLVNFEGVFTGL